MRREHLHRLQQFGLRSGGVLLGLLTTEVSGSLPATGTTLVGCQDGFHFRKIEEEFENFMLKLREPAKHDLVNLDWEFVSNH